MDEKEQILNIVKKVDPDNPISFVTNIVKPLAKEKLDNYILECKDCDICSAEKKTITRGNPNASVFIIGESCTFSSTLPLIDTEDIGNKFQSILNDLNINENQLFFMNSVNCFPFRQQEHNGKIDLIKRAPTVKERTNCKVFLDYALQIVQPLLIICLGSVATNDINEEIGKQNITKIRGNYFMYRGIPVMPTYHPNFFNELKKNNVDEEIINNYYKDFYNDIKKAFTDVQNEYTDLNIFNE